MAVNKPPMLSIERFTRPNMHSIPHPKCYKSKKNYCIQHSQFLSSLILSMITTPSLSFGGVLVCVEYLFHETLFFLLRYHLLSLQYLSFRPRSSTISPETHEEHENVESPNIRLPPQQSQQDFPSLLPINADFNKNATSYFQLTRCRFLICFFLTLTHRT